MIPLSFYQDFLVKHQHEARTNVTTGWLICKTCVCQFICVCVCIVFIYIYIHANCIYIHIAFHCISYQCTLCPSSFTPLIYMKVQKITVIQLVLFLPVCLWFCKPLRLRFACLKKTKCGWNLFGNLIFTVVYWWVLTMYWCFLRSFGGFGFSLELKKPYIKNSRVCTAFRQKKTQIFTLPRGSTAVSPRIILHISTRWVPSQWL